MKQTIREQVAEKANQAKVERLEHLRDKFMSLLGVQFGLAIATLVDEGLIIRLDSYHRNGGIQIRLTDELFVNTEEWPGATSRWSKVIYDWEGLHKFFQIYSDKYCVFPRDVAKRYYSSYLVDTEETNTIALL